MILLIDNYDSFTYNLVQYFGDLGAPCIVHRNDQIDVDEAMAINADAIVISPGPCDPDRAGICLDLIEAAASQNRPLLGVCLGYQAIGQVFGAEVVRAKTPMHGKTSEIHHQGGGVFHGLPNPMEATRYHSLILDRDTIPDELEITAETQDGIAMGLSHRTLNLHGVQFHPESIATRHGHDLLRNFLTLVTDRTA